jgi:predicted PurR-regulated permease PerM
MGCCIAVVVRGDVSESCSGMADGMALVLVFELCSGMASGMALVLVSELCSGMVGGMALVLVFVPYSGMAVGMTLVLVSLLVRRRTPNPYSMFLYLDRELRLGSGTWACVRALVCTERR